MAIKKIIISLLFLTGFAGLVFAGPVFISPAFACPEAFTPGQTTPPTLKEFIEFVIKEQGVRSQHEYNNRRKIDKITFRRFPSRPDKKYPGFKWPGINVTSANLPSYKEFYRVVIEEYGISNRGEYFKQRKMDDTLKRFPSQPEDVYKVSIWQRKKITSDNLPSYEEFYRVVVEEYGIISRKEYFKQRKVDDTLKRFPSEPEKAYPDFKKWPGKK